MIYSYMFTKLSKEFKVKRNMYLKYKKKITYQLLYLFFYLKTYIIKYVTKTKPNLEFAMYILYTKYKH